MKYEIRLRLSQVLLGITMFLSANTMETTTLRDAVSSMSSNSSCDAIQVIKQLAIEEVEGRTKLQVILENRIARLESLVVELTNTATTGTSSQLQYNYPDVLAQALCGSLEGGKKMDVSAIRRKCASGGLHTCAEICERDASQCYDAIHLYVRPRILRPNPDFRNPPDEGVRGLSTYRYTTRGCTYVAGGCGPNYCCCKRHA